MSPLSSDGSCGSQGGRLDRINGGKRRSRESQKTTLGSQRTYLKTGIVIAKKKSQLTLSQGILKKGVVINDVDDDDEVKTNVTELCNSNTEY